MTNNLNNIGFYILFVMVLIGLSIYFYSETISYFPSHIHAWTQSDRYAIALMFLQEGFNFFKPQTYNLSTVDGVTGVDLPIHEFLVALIMKAIGTDSPIVFRVYTLFFSFIGYLFLFRLTNEITGSKLKGLVLVIFVFTCPIITYYQAGFIPSSTGFSTAIIAYYFYFRFKNANHSRDFYYSILFMTLAALTRTPFNIFLFAILLQELWVYVKGKKVNWNHVIAFSLAYGAVISYNLYKAYLNNTYGTQFLTYLLPARSIEELVRTFSLVRERWTFQLFSIYHYYLLIIAIASVSFSAIRQKQFRFTEKQILLHVLISFSGAVLYFILMARQFVAHEYYFMDTFYLPIFLFLLLGIKGISFDLNIKKVLWLIAFASLLIGGAIESKSVQDLKYSETLWDRGEVTRKNFIDADIFLDELNISRDAKILVIDAYSTNAPLILMGRRGYTVHIKRREKIKKGLKEDFDYIVMQDIFIPSEVVFLYPEILSQIERIAGNGRISVFKLNPIDHNRKLSDILGIVDPYKIVEMDFDTIDSSSEWTNIDQVTSEKSHSPSNSFFIDNTTEFGPTFEIITGEKTFNKLLFEGYLLSPTPGNDHKNVIAISDSEDLIYYWEFPLNMRYQKKGEWFQYQCLFTLPDDIKPGSTLKWYFWNPRQDQLYLDDIRITLYQN